MIFTSPTWRLPGGAWGCEPRGRLEFVQGDAFPVPGGEGGPSAGKRGEFEGSERAAGPAAAGGRRRAEPAGNRPKGGWPAAVCLPFLLPCRGRGPLGMRGADRPPGNEWNLRGERAAGPAAAGGRRRAEPAGNRPEGGWPAAVCLPQPEYKPSEQRRPLSCLFCSKMSLPPWHATRNL